MYSVVIIILGCFIFDFLLDKEKIKRKTLEKRHIIDMNMLLNKLSKANDVYILSPSIDGGRMEFGKMLRMGRCIISKGEIIVLTEDGENIADARLYIGKIK